MFPIKAKHVRRVCFASKLYPRLSTSLNVDFGKYKLEGRKDGEVFCGGRSKNKDLLSYFGLISESQRGASAHAQFPLFRRSLKKLVDLVENELESIGAQEVLLPTLIPRRLWIDSGRLERQRDALTNVYQLKDRSGTNLLLGPTYEETITQLVGDGSSLQNSQLPLMLYQSSPKFRYEPNPRFGLLRSNEFLMNDMYSFDKSLQDAKDTYELVSHAYANIFKRLGLQCLKFESDPGDIGGLYSHEYQLMVSSGEDTLIKCNSCNYAYNVEMLKTKENKSTVDKCLRCDSADVEQMQALELGHTFLLADTYTRPMNVGFKGENKAMMYYQMGCFGLGLSRILGAGLDLFSIAPDAKAKLNAIGEEFTQMRWPNQVEPFRLGLVTPAKRSKEFLAGSTDFIEKFVGRLLESTGQDLDIIIEDRDKDGIHKRLAKIQCLGVPNIIVVGRRFLDEMPTLELLTLSADKKTYVEHWYSENELCDYIKSNLA